MSPQEKLAVSLKHLKTLQDGGARVIRSSTLSRAHRDRLVKAGYLQEILKGWYLPSQSGNIDEAQASPAAWLAGMRDFVTGYCTERFGANWHLGPENSLRLRTGERTLPAQLQIWASGGNNQRVSLPSGYSLFIYKAPALLRSRPDETNADLRLVELEDALVSVSPTFFALYPVPSTIALRMLDDPSTLLQKLLEGSHSVVAGRLAGALRAVGRDGIANRISDTMRSVGYGVHESSPFEVQPGSAASTSTSPYVLRLRAMWAAMREDVSSVSPESGFEPKTISDVLQRIKASYVADAYHSLSIEGYKITEGLIERVRSGVWNPDGSDQDRRNARAAKGYSDAHRKVVEYITKIMSQESATLEPDRLSGLGDAVGNWYLALFGPSVTAGILKSSDLAGWRNTQVFIRAALHVPPPTTAVRECMPELFDLIEQESNPWVRAVLGHFLFAYIHPYLDGNGRLARFLMNVLLVAGGYDWVVIPVQERRAYMVALERASSYADIVPFAQLVAGLLEAQKSSKIPGK